LIYQTTLNPSGTLPKAALVDATVFEIQTKYMTPFHAATLVDPLLNKVTASQWTTVISDDQLLRQLLSAFFLFINPTWYPFHKDLFLQDMAAGRTQFCSQLLVNTLLSHD
jgi:hypothetical protein